MVIKFHSVSLSEILKGKVGLLPLTHPGDTKILRRKDVQVQALEGLQTDEGCLAGSLMNHRLSHVYVSVSGGNL